MWALSTSQKKREAGATGLKEFNVQPERQDKGNQRKTCILGSSTFKLMLEGHLKGHVTMLRICKWKWLFLRDGRMGGVQYTNFSIFNKTVKRCIKTANVSLQ